MIKKETLFLFLTLLLLNISCTSNKKPYRDTRNRINIVSHKGLHLDSIAPENSLDALILAERCGFKSVEFDFTVTSDGEFVMMHDDSLNIMYRNVADYSPLKTTVNCHENTLSDLQEKYVLVSPNPSFRRPIPTLTEFLNKCSELNIFPYIELKADYLTNPLALKAYKTAMQILGRGNFALTCFDSKVIDYLRSTDPELELYCDIFNKDLVGFNYTFNEMIRNNIEYYAFYKWLTPDAVKTFHEAGKHITVWTVPKEDYDETLKMNVDVILSDDIAPSLDYSKAIVQDQTDGTFSNYIGGSRNNNILTLEKNETLDFNPDLLQDSIYLGAVYIIIEAKGSFKLESNELDSDKNASLKGDYTTYYYQFIIHNKRPKLKITALDNSVQIKSIKFAVCKF
ncbi:glycerophosphoryl diester phosphodiesterase [Dysgonomonas alginatilytica]|uniref:Glycerophosphoryl diester phosphodiesterase n=1 Tax=Dysgonomonas alginatilytica TaxID=1605892 RepID=A0A2V3PP28_9BACT|nr:glycerophosphodiester phosphodiesterase family protein [Dysgonomonas alginatilytica]PXV64453.1 glycerophosphoryl diester phosphodiesterase [Dysgonomonas alginatilytica]